MKNLTTEQCDDFNECAEADDLCGDFETCVNNIGSGVGTCTRSSENLASRKKKYWKPRKSHGI